MHWPDCLLCEESEAGLLMRRCSCTVRCDEAPSHAADACPSAFWHPGTICKLCRCTSMACTGTRLSTNPGLARVRLCVRTAKHSDQVQGSITCAAAARLELALDHRAVGHAALAPHRLRRRDKRSAVVEPQHLLEPALRQLERRAADCAADVERDGVTPLAREVFERGAVPLDEQRTAHAEVDRTLHSDARARRAACLVFVRGGAPVRAADRQRVLRARGVPPRISAHYLATAVAAVPLHTGALMLRSH
jgi:hypothetical protein